MHHFWLKFILHVACINLIACRRPYRIICLKSRTFYVWNVSFIRIQWVNSVLSLIFSNKKVWGPHDFFTTFGIQIYLLSSVYFSLFCISGIVVIPKNMPSILKSLKRILIKLLNNNLFFSLCFCVQAFVV